MPNLDDELFDEINENARNMISQVYPQWTNYNKSDAGITFIELFSWFKEMQQYYLNQMSDSLKEKYLVLLGMKKNDKSLNKRIAVLYYFVALCFYTVAIINFVKGECVL